MSNNISTVRQALLDTLADLLNRDNTMEIERARAVADIARVIVDSAKVEPNYLKVTGQSETPLLDHPDSPPALPNGITGSRQHKLR
ncbi:hypothetical protein PCA31118_00137 [Pandoraea captiosa]|uniref:Uncharacterized protein n=1 Tax=Pandoraea captiosa TaxID=2508302 RepID=A0A5E4ZGM6_9BURK|nr:hypothetical protein [Pandoraea captiosa]VVE60146.1 hypothetical protein PCA31118_00137 [Pandoraea captiosa]